MRRQLLQYRIEKTNHFDKWLRSLRNRQDKLRILERLARIESCGHFGDSKALGDGVRELRFDIGQGYRIYYAMRQSGDVYVLVILLIGGDKDSQQRDIAKAKKLYKEIE